MIPVGSTAPRARLAIVVLAMVAACCGVFLWQQSLSTQESFLVTVHYALIPLRYSDPAWAILHGLDPSDYLPYLSMAFLHGGWAHLVINIVWLSVFGSPLAYRIGWAPDAWDELVPERDYVTGLRQGFRSKRRDDGASVDANHSGSARRHRVLLASPLA